MQIPRGAFAATLLPVLWFGRLHMFLSAGRAKKKDACLKLWKGMDSQGRWGIANPLPSRGSWTTPPITPDHWLCWVGVMGVGVPQNLENCRFPIPRVYELLRLMEHRSFLCSWITSQPCAPLQGVLYMPQRWTSTCACTEISKTLTWKCKGKIRCCLVHRWSLSFSFSLRL